MKQMLTLLAVAASVSGCAVVVEEPAGRRSAGGGHEVMVCHKGKTMTLPEEALAGHLKHGDTHGPCRSGRPR